MIFFPILSTAGKLAVESYSEFAPFQPDRSNSYLERRYTNEASQFMEVNGARVHYRDEGPRDAPTIVALHGSYSSLHTWDGWVDELSDDYRIVRLDMPGHGLTGPREGRQSVEAIAITVVMLCEKLGLENVIMAGNSLGGGIAWRIAIYHPQIVSKLVLINSGGATLLSRMSDNLVSFGTDLIPRYMTPRLIIRLLLLDAYSDNSKISDDLVRRYHDLILRRGNRGALVEIAANYMADHYDEEMHEVIDAGVPTLPSMHDPSPKNWDDYNMADIEQPALFLWGCDDEWLSVSFGMELAEQVPDSTFLTYPDVGHVAMEEAPGQTAADAAAWLAGADIQSRYSCDR